MQIRYTILSFEVFTPCVCSHFSWFNECWDESGLSRFTDHLTWFNLTELSLLVTGLVHDWDDPPLLENVNVFGSVQKWGINPLLKGFSKVANRLYQFETIQPFLNQSHSHNFQTGIDSHFCESSMGTTQFAGFNELVCVFETIWNGELIHLFVGDKSHLNQVSFLVAQDSCHQTTTLRPTTLLGSTASLVKLSPHYAKVLRS